MRNFLLLICYFTIGALGLHSQLTATLSPVANNTLYEDAVGGLSNGQGQYLFVGTTNVGTRRRALLRFDVASALPSNATITGASLTLSMNQTIAGATNVSLHLVQNSWGEGSSMASGPEGGGAPSQSNDATWIHRFYTGTFWSTAGGDYVSTPIATQSVSGNGSYTWTSAALVSQAQQWLANPNNNHGVILIGNESTQPTAKRFHSRNSNSIADRPQLILSYTVPCIAPDVPTLQLMNGPLCSGDSAIVSISGNLNSATHWQIYSGNCAGTPIGQSSGNTFVLGLNQTDTWFIRGEGGCISPGNCAQITLNVTQNDNPTFNYASNNYCVLDGNINPTVSGTSGGVFSVSAGGPGINSGSGMFNTQQATIGQPFTVTYTTPGPQCPSSAAQTITVWPNDTTFLTQTICPGSSLVFNGQSISQPGIYQQTLTSVRGCDSTILLQLNWFPSQSAAFSYSALSFCANNGIVFPQITGTTGGQFSSPMAGSFLNPSTGAIDLSLAPVNQPLTITYTSPGPNCAESLQQSVTLFPIDTLLIQQTICPGDSVLFGSGYVNQTGTYIHIATASTGCDSVLILNLSISNIDPSFNYPSSVACANDPGLLPIVSGTTGGTFSVLPFTTALNPQTGLFQPGLAQVQITYQITYTTPGINCSVSSQQGLTILGIDSTLLAQSICPGDSILFGGLWRQQPGIYNTVFQGISGCDSVVFLQLSWITPEDPSFQFPQDSICLGNGTLIPVINGTGGGTFSIAPLLAGFSTQNGAFPSSSAQANQLYTITYQTPGISCTSQAQQSIYVLQTDSVLWPASICSGDSILWGGQWYAQPGLFTQTLTNTFGCDSVITLQLTVNPTESAVFSYGLDSVCASSGLLSPFNTGTPGGVYKLFPSNNALDSISGIFNPALAQPGQTYSIQYLTPGVLGCADSFWVSLYLVPNDTQTIMLSLCAGDSLLYNSEYFSSEGTYFQVLNNSLGCDSVLQISVSSLSPNASFSITGDTLSALFVSDHYQWYSCTEGNGLVAIPGAQESFYVVGQSGLYALSVGLGVCTDTSSCIPLAYSSLESHAKNEWKYYPNPVRHSLWVESPIPGVITLRDPCGRLIHRQEILGGKASINCSELPQGVYYIHHSEGGMPGKLIISE
jgi:hypothetical protein